MEDIVVAGPSVEHVPADDPAWLIVLLQDCSREGEDTLVMSGSLGLTGRAIVWTMCEKFDRNKTGVLGQTCRVFERYLAHLVRIDNEIDANDELCLFNYMAPRLMLTLACCFQIAMKTTSSTVQVGPKAIRAFLESCGTPHTIAEIVNMEREIFRGIGYHVPLYNSLQMAELLADHLNLPPYVLELTGLFVQLAELRRYDIEKEVRWIAGMHRVPYCTPRVRTVHLAAGCVAAAVKAIGLQASNSVALHLALMLRVTGSYVMVLRDVILVRVAPPKPPRPKPKHRPNILRRKKFKADAGQSEPQPSTSKSTLN